MLELREHIACMVAVAAWLWTGEEEEMCGELERHLLVSGNCLIRQETVELYTGR